MPSVDESLSLVRGSPLKVGPDGTKLTLPGFLGNLVEQWPEREVLAACTASGVRRWTYRDLWQSATTIARALASRGVGKGARVGILMTNRPEFLAAVFGISMAGGVVVVLNTFATPDELDSLIKTSDIEILLFQDRVARRDFGAALTELEPALREMAPGGLVSGRYPFLRLLVSLTEEGAAPSPEFMGWDAFLRRGEQVPESLIDARRASLTPSDTAILFFSSGSTGLPKGVIHNQRAVVVQWRTWPGAMGFNDTVRAWTANGFFWSGNFAMVIGSALATGGSLVLQSLFDAEEALDLIVRERVNAPFAMPHQWGRIAEVPGFNEADLSHLRFFDGRFYGLDNPTLPNTFRQHQAFGCTETLTINTTSWFGEGGETRDEGHGLPLPGNTLKIVDPVSGDILPRGERGEIAVKGPTLMMHYLGKTPDQCFDDEGYYRTGDGGYVDESGWLFWEGRLTDIIKTGGANVSPQEVDEVIITWPPIKAAQTVGLPHDTLGEIVVSCIVPHQGMAIDVEEFRQFLREKLASYKVPKEILVFDDGELALTASGNKIKAGEVKRLAGERLATLRKRET